MSDRPTPESDETHRLNCLPSTPHETAYRYVLNLARRLERERDEARDTIADVLSALNPMHNEGPRLAALRVKEERDEAREAAEKAKAYKRVMKEDNAKLRRELDELNKRLIEVCQYGVVCTVEREDLHKEVAAERALADRLAESLHQLTKCCPTVKCEHLHHQPKDRHSYDSQCPVEQRYCESVNRGLENYNAWKEERK